MKRTIITRSAGRTLQSSYKSGRNSVAQPPRLRRSVIMVSHALRGLRRGAAGLAALQLLALTPAALALPTGENVVGGTAAVNTVGDVMTVTQSTPKAILEWTSFSIAAPETVNFAQPSTSAVALNRVLGGSQSEIFGALNANGHVFLVNPSGILFAPGASVNVGGLVASTLNISNADFEAGTYVFERVLGSAAGSVVNQTSINITTPNSYAALLGTTVSNEGIIAVTSTGVTDRGAVSLAAGDRVTLNIVGDNLINVSVDAAAAGAMVLNTAGAQILADGGQVFLTARSADALLGTVINTEGLIRANSLISGENGTIVLDGGEKQVSIGGTIEARGIESLTNGGNVSVSAREIQLNSSSTINVNGDAADGTIALSIGNGGPGNLTIGDGATLSGDTINVAGSADTDAIQVTRDANMTLTDTSLTVTGAYTLNLSSIETATLTGGISANSFTVSGWSGTGTISGGDSSDTIVASNDVSTVVLTDTSLARDGLGTLTLASIEEANLTGGVGDNTITATAFTGAVTVNATAGTDAVNGNGTNTTFVGLNETSTWDTTATNSGTYTSTDTTTLTDVGHWVGGSAQDTFNLAHDVVSVAGGDESDIFNVASITPITSNLSGGAGDDVFNINAELIGSVAGQAGDDTVTLNTGGSVSGTVAGGAGSDTLNGTAIVDVVLTASDADGFTGTTAGAGGFTGIDTVVATGTGTLTGRDATSAWELDGTPTYSDGTATLNFSGFATLQGGGQGDTFTVSAPMVADLKGGEGDDAFNVNAALTGSVAGEAGNDTVTLSPVGSVSGTVAGGADSDTLNGTVDVALTASDGDGFTGTTAGTGGFTGIDTVAGTGTLTGRDVTSTWVLDGTPTYSDGAATLNFSGFATLQGGGQVDTFTVSASTVAELKGGTGNDVFNVNAALTGSVDGEVGIDTLAGSTTYEVTGLNSGTAANVSGGFSNVENLAGTGDADSFTLAGGTLDGTIDGLAGNDTLTGDDVPNLWAITGPNSGTLTGVTGGWSNIENLVGGGATDTFTGAGGSIAGALTDASAPRLNGVLNVGSASLGEARLDGNTTVNAGTGNVTFNGGILGEGNALVVNTSGTTTFNGEVGLTPLLSLTTDAGGTTILGNGITVFTTGAQTYNDAVSAGTLVLRSNGGDITAVNTSNDFTGTVTTEGGNVSLVDANDLTVSIQPGGTANLTALAGALTVSGTTSGNLTTQSGASTSFGSTVVDGNLSATSGADITQTASLLVTGTSFLDAVGNITLDSGANNFVGAVTAEGNNIALVDSDSLTASIDALGSASLTAPGSLTVSGQTGGDLTASGAAVISFGLTDVGGNLSATAAGTISQTEALTVTGTTSLQASVISLTDGDNDFGGQVTATGDSITLVDLNDLMVTVTAGAGPASLTAGGALAVYGTTVGNLTTDSGTSTSFGDTDVAGSLTATAGTHITQTGVLKVTGPSMLDAGGDITLANTDNDLTGAVTATGGNITLVDQNSLAVSVTDGGFADLTAGAALTVSGSTVGDLTTSSGTGTTFGATTAGGDLSSTAGGAIEIAGDMSAETLRLTSTGSEIFRSAGTVSGTTLVLSAADGVGRGGGGTPSRRLVTQVSNLQATSGGPVEINNTGNLVLADIDALGYAIQARFGGVVITNAGSVTVDADVSGAGRIGIAANGASSDLNIDADITGGVLADGLPSGFIVSAAAPNGVNLSAGRDVVQSTGVVRNRFDTNGNDILIAAGRNGSGIVAVSDNGNVVVTAGNDLAVDATAAGSATLTATGGALSLRATTGTALTTSSGTTTTFAGASSVGTNLTSSSGGAVTQTAALTVAGTSSINASGSAITLDNLANDFTGLVTLTGTVVRVIDANALAVQLTTGETYIIANASGTTGDLTLGGTTGNLVAVTNGGVLQWTNLTTANAILIAGTPAINGVTSLGGITGPSSTGNVLAENVTYSNLADTTGLPTAPVPAFPPALPPTLTVNGELVLIAENLPRTSSGDFPSIQAGTAILDINSLNPGDRLTLVLSGALRLLADTGTFRFREGSEFPGGVTTLNPDVVQVLIGGQSLTSTRDELAQRAARTAAQQSALSSASSDARQSFGTDSVLQQIDMGFAGDVGIAPTMGHSVPLEGEIISTPGCVSEAKSGQACKQ